MRNNNKRTENLYAYTKNLRGYLIIKIKILIILKYDIYGFVYYYINKVLVHIGIVVNQLC